MPLTQWPKHPIIGLLLIITAIYLAQMWPAYFWVPVVVLVVLLILTRKWTAAPLVALALLILGFYFSMRFGEWKIRVGGYSYGASFWYAVLYTVAILTMGVRFIVLYWGRDKYMIYRTCFNMAAQLFIGFMAAYLLPYEWMGGSRDSSGSGVFFMYVWPLEVNALLIGKYYALSKIVKIFLAYNLIAALVIMPVLVYFHGRKLYCSWLCGCGCLAETFGDPFRRLTPRSRWARKVEPVIWIFVVAAILFTVYALLAPKEKLAAILDVGEHYDLVVKFVFASLAGVGLYSLMGARIWCRYFCPWAGLFGLLAYYGRYAIRTRGELCMACGMCNTYCEMGIDIRGHAMRGEPVKTTSCVGCGMCIQKCPRRVLSFAVE